MTALLIVAVALVWLTIAAVCVALCVMAAKGDRDMRAAARLARRRGARFRRHRARSSALR